MPPPTMGSPALTNEEAGSGVDDIQERKRIHKQLQDEASTEVKRLIQAYKLTVKYETNMKALTRFTDETLEETAKFFGANPTDENGNKRYTVQDQEVPRRLDHHGNRRHVPTVLWGL